MKNSPLRVAVLILVTSALLLGCATAERSLASKGETTAPKQPAAPAEEPALPAPSPSTDEAAAVGDDKAIDIAKAEEEFRAAGSRAADFGDGEKSLGFVEERAAAPGRAPAAPAGGGSAPSASGLQAGFADDNRQFNYFVNFLAQFGDDVSHLPIPVEERIVIRVTDAAGKSLPNAAVSVSGGGAVLAAGRTYADGSFLFFPSEHPAALDAYTVSVTSGKATRSVAVDRAGKRQVDVKLQAARPVYQNVPLDILFVLDTTGSMGEEIQRLKTTLEIINLNLAALSSRPRVRFGMVLYRDQGDDYVTQVVPLTEDLPAFRRALEPVAADGGGDDPEDLQSALHDAMRSIR